MTNNEIFQDFIKCHNADDILLHSSKDQETPFGFVITYIRNFYGIPKTIGWDIADRIIQYYNL